MVFSANQLVSKLSHDMTLLPGDVICCGTSAGVGTMKEKRNVIDVEIEGIGRLTNAFVQQRLLLSAERFGSAFVRDASDGIGPSGVLSGRCQGLPNRFANPMGARRNDDTYRLQGCNLARSIGALVFG
jgi:Fumarylacetoacetate (FAA) hydrolase family